jgi:hypothetical protein
MAVLKIIEPQVSIKPSYAQHIDAQTFEREREKKKR